MLTRRFFSFLYFILLLGSLRAGDVTSPAPVFPVPSEKQIAWHEMEMNAFVHFTINTFTNLEWGMGNESPELFNPDSTNVSQWTEIIKGTGFKGLIFTCKHHDGFCLWPSAYTEHNIKYSPYKNGKGDLVKEVSDACKKSGLKFGIYMSPWDRNQATYGTPEYITYYRNQLKELFTNYGPVFEMWFDGANGGTGYYGGANEKRSINGATYYEWPKTINIVREMSPNTLFFSDAGPDIRWCGNEDGKVDETCWATISPDTLYAGKSNTETILGRGSEDGNRWIPAETDVSIRPGWFYHQKEDSLVKTPQQLFDIYLKSVGRGALLLLNIPPDKRGLINNNDVKALAGFKELLQKEFNTNLTKGAKISTSATRGKSLKYAAANLIDGNKDTYWATDDQTTTGDITVDFTKTKQVKYIVLQEYIKLGQRIKSFHVDYWNGKKWETLTSATTIGYKRILKIDPVQTQKIRICFTESKACPVISNLEIY